MGFAIQVRKIEPSLVGIAEDMLVATKNMEEHKTQPPTSMVKDNKSIKKPLHTPVVQDIGKGIPSSNQENQMANILTKAQRIKSSSVGISKSLLFAKEDMNQYKIQLPTSMETADT